MMGSMGHGAEKIDPEELQGTGDVGFHFCFVYFLFGSHTTIETPPRCKFPSRGECCTAEYATRKGKSLNHNIALEGVL